MTEKQLRHEVSRLIEENTIAWDRNGRNIMDLATAAGIDVHTCYNILGEHSGGLKQIIKVLYVLGYELEIKKIPEKQS